MKRCEPSIEMFEMSIKVSRFYNHPPHPSPRPPLPIQIGQLSVTAESFKYGHLLVVNRFGGLSLPRKRVNRLTDHARHDLNNVDWAVKS